MMFKTLICLFLSFTLIMPQGVGFSSDFLKNYPEKKVLILYDRRNHYGYLNDEITSIRELSGHFNTKVTELNIASYTSGQLNQYDHIFIVGLEKDFHVTPFLMDDLKNTQKSIMLVGEAIKISNQFYQEPIITIEKNDSSVLTTTYQGHTKQLKTQQIIPTIHYVNPSIQTVAYANDGENDIPFLFKYQNVTCMTVVESSSLFFYILADALHEFYNEQHPINQKIYLRIEDVHALRDYKKLIQISDYLNSENIPFVIVLIGGYKNLKTGKIHALSQYPDFIKVLHYMESKGGSFILHGFTHQTKDDPTGEGFEFWDGENDKPLSNTRSLIQERVGLGLQEAVNNQIYPLGFEAPHYAMSQEGFETLKQYFSTYVGQIQTSDEGFTTTIIPYITHQTKLVNTLLPESLGYVAEGDSQAFEKIAYQLDEISYVRDFTAGVFFHPYLELDQLKDLVALLKQKGPYDYLDLKEMNHWIKFQGYDIVLKDGKMSVKVPAVDKKFSIHSTAYTGSIYLAGFVAACCLLFLILFIISRRRILKRTFKK